MLGVFAYSCKDVADDDDPLPIALAVKEIAKRANTDVRDSYGIFHLRTNHGTLKNYRLGVKEAGQAAPSADDMKDYGLRRNIGSKGINVLIAQRLNAPIVEYAKDSTANPVPAGINVSSRVLWEQTAAGANAWITESVLKPNTNYKLYSMKDGTTEVKERVSFKTDAVPAMQSIATDETPVPLDSSLKGLTVSINANEFYIYPMQLDYKFTVTGNGINTRDFTSSKQLFGRVVILDNGNVFGGIMGAGLSGDYVLSKKVGATADSDVDFFRSYVLIDTAAALREQPTVKTWSYFWYIVYDNSPGMSLDFGNLAVQ